MLKKDGLFLRSDVLSWGLRICALLPVLGTVTILIFLLYKGSPTLGPELFFGETPALDAVLGRQAVWDGLWPACVGTICLVVLAIALALFPGISCGLYLAEFARSGLASRIRLAMDVLAGTSSIVMGLFGFTLIIFLRNVLHLQVDTCLFLSAACLALLVLPVIVTTTCESIEAIPAELRITLMTLGFSKREAARSIIVPAALPGIRGGVVLALGRAAEDTAVIMLTGVVVNAGLPASLWDKFEALPFFIFYTAAQYQDQDEMLLGFGATLVLLSLASGLVLLASWIEHRFYRRWRTVS